MQIKYKVWLLTTAIISLIVCADMYLGYRNIEAAILDELTRDAKDIRALLMATRRVYHKQFLASGVQLSEKTVGFLPAYALPRISKDFQNWSGSGLKFNNVSDRPRNPDNQADQFELEAMAWFRANPKKEERLVEIRDTDGKDYYHLTAPIWVEAYCLNCHGSRDQAPPSIAAMYADSYDYQLGDLRGVLSIKLPTQALKEREFSAWRHRIGSRLVGYFILLIALGYFLNRYVANRLFRLKETAEKLAAGDYAARSAEFGQDEVGILAASINKMGGEIQQRDRHLKESEERFRLTSENIQDALVLIDGEQGRIMYWNKAAEGIFGYTETEVMGQVLHDFLVPPHLRQGMANALRSFVDTGQGAAIGHLTETTALRKDGQEIEVELSLSSMKIQGKWIGVGLVRDITERKRVEAELQIHREHLEALVETRTADLTIAKNAAETANIAKSAFLANMSHEIRTPLNAITGMTHLVMREGVSARQAERLGKVMTAGQHLLDIINDILDLSKIEADKIVLEETAVRPETVLANVRSMLFEKAMAKQLSIVVETDHLPPHLLGDPTRLQQALLNFAANAVKFTERGQIVLRVRTECEEAHQVMLRFEVEDTGIGIDQETIRRLFTPFEQADNTTSRKYGGTGLGLVITRRLAELMGGTANVESTVGVGSTFWFSAKLKKAPATTQELAQKTSPVEVEATLSQKHAGRRVLLVEDEAINAEVTRSLLVDVGLAVDLAENGQLAIEYMQHQSYDLVLMDIQMPVLNGLEATRHLRSTPQGSQVPIIALTANAFAEDRARCLAVGMNDFIAKPVSPDALFETVLKWLNGAA